MSNDRDQTTIERLTQAELRRLYQHWDGVDRALTERLATMYLNGKSGVISPDGARGVMAHARATQLLNGHGKVLLGKKSVEGGPSESDVYQEREAVRVILSAVTAKSVEAEAIELQERVQNLLPAWRPIIRDWLAAAKKFAQATERAEAFLDADEATSRHLPLSGFVAASGRIGHFVGGWDIAEILAAAKAEGV